MVKSINASNVAKSNTKRSEVNRKQTPPIKTNNPASSNASVCLCFTQYAILAGTATSDSHKSNPSTVSLNAFIFSVRIQDMRSSSWGAPKEINNHRKTNTALTLALAEPQLQACKEGSLGPWAARAAKP